MTTKLGFAACAIGLGIALWPRTAHAQSILANLPIEEQNADYPWTAEKDGFGAGLDVGDTFEAYDHAKVCAALPTLNAYVQYYLSALPPGTPGFFLALAQAGLMKQYNAISAQYCGDSGEDVNVKAYASASAELFGESATILGADAYANADATSALVGFDLSVLGQTIVSLSVPATLTYPAVTHQTFFEAEASFGVGPFCVSASASATGSFGVIFSASAGTAGVQLSGTPVASVDGNIDASIGKWLVEVGVEGDLNLFDLQLPTTGSLSLADYGSTTMNWTGTCQLTFNALAGDISLYAKVCGAQVASVSLFSWSGIPQQTVPVFSESGSFNL